MSIFLEIKKDINFYNKISKQRKFENVWEQRRKNFRNILIDSDNNINKKYFINFRSHKNKFISENPSIKLNNFFKKLLYNHQIKYNKFMYKKMVKANKDLKKIFNSLKLDEIGNPGYCKIDGNKINERFLRHCHFFSILKKKISIKKINYITDIGGGYGSFSRMVHQEYKKIKVIIVDLPEQLLLAKYYLSCNFKKSRISNLVDAYKAKKIDKKFLDKYEIVLVPNTEFKKIKINYEKNLVTNFNSFGEMDKSSFNDYFKSNLLNKSKYLFSVNRIDSFPTYNNNITMFDYKFENYKNIHFCISPVWDVYFIKAFFIFTKKKFFSSRKIEFIGQRLNEDY